MVTAAEMAAEDDEIVTSRQPSTAWYRWLSPSRIGALYVLIVLVLVFASFNAGQILSLETAKLVLNQYATTAMVGLALVIPLAAGIYDLSVGSVAALSGMTTAWWLAHVSASPVLAIAVGLAVALMVGVINGLVVVVFKIDSFIGTLATSSIVLAIATAISGDTTIAQNVTGGFQDDVALTNLGGITLPVFLALGIAIVLYWVLERSAFGRRTYSIGFDVEVARLGGVDVGRIRFTSLLISSCLAGLAGIVATAIIGAGDPSTGPNLLLPAFAVAFLGATQFKLGRFNVWGTILAVLLLGAGNIGLVIVGAPSWAPDVFDGAMLIAAVGLTSMKGFKSTNLRRVLERYRKLEVTS